MKKQTAVEFLLQEFSVILNKTSFTLSQDLYIRDAIVKAKAMEQEQIIKAYDESNKLLCLQCTDFKIGADYYQINFNKEIGKL